MLFDATLPNVLRQSHIRESDHLQSLFPNMESKCGYPAAFLVIPAFPIYDAEHIPDDSENRIMEQIRDTIPEGAGREPGGRDAAPDSTFRGGKNIPTLSD